LFLIILVTENVLKKFDKPIFLCALLRKNSRMKNRKSFFETCNKTSRIDLQHVCCMLRPQPPIRPNAHPPNRHFQRICIRIYVDFSECVFGPNSPPAAGRPTNAAHLAQGQMTRFFCTAHKVPNELGQPHASIINKPSKHNNKSLNKFIM